MRLIFLTSLQNIFLGKKALVAYGIVTMLTFSVLLPKSEFDPKALLSTLTQGLVVTELNPHREVADLLSLNTNEKLTLAAQMKAEDMLARDYFSHNGPDGERPWVWLDRVDYAYAAAGENLAIDFSDSRALVNAWLASPTHAKNILNGYFTDVGIGIADGFMQGHNTTVVAMFLGRELTPTIEILVAEAGSENITEDPQVELVPPPQEPTPQIQDDTPSVNPNEDVEPPEVLAASSQNTLTPPQEPLVEARVEFGILEEANKIASARSALQAPSEQFFLGVSYFSPFEIVFKVARVLLVVFFSMLLLGVISLVMSHKNKNVFLISRGVPLAIFSIILLLV